MVRGFWGSVLEWLVGGRGGFSLAIWVWGFWFWLVLGFLVFGVGSGSKVWCLMLWLGSFMFVIWYLLQALGYPRHASIVALATLARDATRLVEFATREKNLEALATCHLRATGGPEVVHAVGRCTDVLVLR